MYSQCNLEEFAAHAGKVNCLRIGRKSGRVLVTGGSDLVNVWAIGKTTPVMVITRYILILIYIEMKQLIYRSLYSRILNIFNILNIFYCK
jgi:hypothetical protein